MANLAPGTVVADRFRIDSVVASTQAATIYAATDTKKNQRFFLKVLLSMLAKDREDLGRFEREFELMAKLRHAAVASVFEMGVAPGGEPFQVMEFMEGTTLAKKLEGGALKVKEALTIAMQLLDALRLTHQQQIIHRDVQPANLFVVSRPDGSLALKVISFGQARAQGAAAAGSQQLTAYGATLGSPEYMSPEQAKGGDLDGRSDLYSVGCVAYAMLTGAPPFPGKQTAQVIMRQLKEDPKSIQQVKPDVPPWFDLWTRRCLRKDPRERFGSAGEAREALEGALSTGIVAPAPEAFDTAQSAASEAPSSFVQKPLAPSQRATATGAAAGSGPARSATPVATLPSAASAGRSATPIQGVPVGAPTRAGTGSAAMASATAQRRAEPATSASAASSSGGSKTPLVIGIVVGVILLALTVVFALR